MAPKSKASTRGKQAETKQAPVSKNSTSTSWIVKVMLALMVVVLGAALRLLPALKRTAIEAIGVYDGEVGTCSADGTCGKDGLVDKDSRKSMKFTVGVGIDKLGIKFSATPPAKTLVKKITPNGWAEGAGIKEGDELASMNSRPLPSLSKEEFKDTLAVRPLEIEVLRAISKKKPWWRNVSIDERDRFGTEDVVIVNTLNFNETVTKLYRHIMIAYYDPRSVSFRDTKEGLVEAAKVMMQRRRELGDNITDENDWGVIGACDVTVNNYLTGMEAPELTSGWQETRASQKKAFTFGQARWWPVILKMYAKGERTLEYRGVINSENIAPYMRRHKYPEITDLRSKHQLNTFLEHTDPVVVGCGLRNESDEWAAFNDSARFFRGLRVFGRVADDKAAVCQGLGTPPGLNGTNESGPAVLMVMAGGYKANVPFGVENISKTEHLNNSETLIRMIFETRTEQLPEMTADNSHMYLRNPYRPLLIFMYHGTKTDHRDAGLQLLARLPQYIFDKVSVVWSDCKFYGKQFGVKNLCPVMLAVNVATLETSPAPLANFTMAIGSRTPTHNLPWMNATQLPQERLEGWLKNVTGTWLEGFWMGDTFNDTLNESFYDDLLNFSDMNLSNDSTSRNGSSVNGTDDESVEEYDPYEGSVKDTSVQFIELLTSLEEAKLWKNITTDAKWSFVNRFGALYRHIVDMRDYYQQLYPHLDFDWKGIEKIKTMHKHMHGAAWPSDSDMVKVIRDPAKLKTLKAKVEEYAVFMQGTDEVLADGLEIHKQPVDDPQYIAVLEKAMRTVARTFKRMFVMLEHRARKGTLGVEKPTPIDVDRRSASELTMREFIEKYANPGLPVIITDINVSTVNNWNDLEFFKERCGSAHVQVQKQQANLSTWGGLRGAGVLNMSDFIDTYRQNESRQDWYVFDWPLPRNCPQIFGSPPWDDFKMPKYFAGDYFQRTPFQGYQHTWPSLFIGAQGTGASMHIDSGGTNFIFHLLSGEKEWRFYRRHDIINLYFVPESPSFFFDPFEPDFDKYPLAEYATMYKTTQRANEVMFIPANSPHGVKNPTDIHGISMNYVDVSNLGIYLREMLLKGEYKSFEEMTDTDFPHGLKEDQQDLTFGEWKSQPWRTMSYDIL